MSTFVKKIFPFCALITVLLISSLNIDTSNNTATHPRSASNKIELDNDDILSQSTHIIDAIYLGEYVTDSGTELMFKPVKEIKGTLDGDNQEIIYVRPFNDEYVTISKKNSFDFTRNEKYMLFLEKYTSVYYEHDNFVQLGEIILSSEDSQWDEYHTLANKISETSRTSVPAEYGVAYSDATELSTLIDFSHNIFVVNVEAIYATSDVAPTTVYECKVTKIAKGELNGDDDILITFFNDTVSIGSEYIVLLADATETAPVYTLSSKSNCIYSVNDERLSPELQQLLSLATDFSPTADFRKSDQDILAEEQKAYK